MLIILNNENHVDLGEKMIFEKYEIFADHQEEPDLRIDFENSYGLNKYTKLDIQNILEVRRLVLSLQSAFAARHPEMVRGIKLEASQ